MHRQIFWPILSAFLISSFISNGQLIEFGGGIGSMSYAGDLNRGIKSSNQNLGFQAHYRMNLSKIVSTKFSATFGSFSGDDLTPIDPAANLRQASFSRSIMEITGAFEYHFLDYKNDKSLIKWSPYAFVGFGFFKINGHDPAVDDISAIQPVLPFGIGFKHMVGKRFSIDLELGARKVFSDKLDAVSDGDIFDKNYQYGNPKDNDWYHFAGISLSYILYNIPCIYKYIPNKSIYN